MDARSTWEIKTLPDYGSYKGPIALDTETYDPALKTKGPGFIKGLGSYMIGFSYAMKGAYGYVPVKHNSGNFQGNWKDWLKKLVGDREREIVFANARYDLEVLWSEGIEVKAKIIDVQTLDALINENNETFDLGSIALRRNLPPKGTAALEQSLIDFGFVVRGKPDYSRLKDLPLHITGEYAETDAAITLAIYEQQIEEIKRDELQAVADLEAALHPILWQMRLKGVRVTVSQAEIENVRLQEQNQIKLNYIRDCSEFNVEPWASASLARWVRSLGFDPPQTEKGRDSISNNWLKNQGHPLLTEMAEYREAEKIRRDFVEALVIDSSLNSRVHPQWFSTRGSASRFIDDYSGTRSGRIACTGPNLTQIPARHSVYGPLVRSLFLPEPGEQWGKFDYASQEPRITVHYAYRYGLEGAAEIREIYLNNPNADYHQATVDLIERVSGLKISRAQGKTINLGLAYGMGRDKLARSLGLEKEAAKEVLEAYHKAMSFVKDLTKFCDNHAQKRGYIRTVLGRRRHFDTWEKAEFNSKLDKERYEPPVESEQEARQKWGTVKRANTYKALNAAIQGTAAEQTKTAIIALYNKGYTPLVQVYDELGYSIKNEAWEVNEIKNTMENAIEFYVPHSVEAKLGKSWVAK